MTPAPNNWPDPARPGVQDARAAWRRERDAFLNDVAERIRHNGTAPLDCVDDIVEVIRSAMAESEKRTPPPPPATPAVLVPREPTREMLEAAQWHDLVHLEMIQIYELMVRAAPPQPRASDRALRAALDKLRGLAPTKDARNSWVGGVAASIDVLTDALANSPDAADDVERRVRALLPTWEQRAKERDETFQGDLVVRTYRICIADLRTALAGGSTDVG